MRTDGFRYLRVAVAGQVDHEIAVFQFKEIDVLGAARCFGNIGKAHWVKLLGDYLQQRRQLIGLILIMDSRHPLKALDIQMLDFFHITGRPVHILLSKADKLSKNDQIKTLAAVKKSLKPYTERQKISVQLFSSLKKQGMDEVNQVVGSWFDAHREEIENLAGETSPE